MSLSKKKPVRKTKKKSSKEPQLVTQEDFYIEATQQEEQAERWILSDIKKTLRFYIQAYDLYNQALHNPVEATESGRYNILYNQTRLNLVVYTEYLAANGYINVLAYLKNLDELAGLDSIILSLPQIVAKFEAVLQEFTDNNAVANFWDLKFNLLTCYLLLAESVNDEGSTSKSVNASGEDVIELVQNKFIPCFKDLVTEITTSLNDWNEIQNSTTEELSQEDLYQRDTLQDQQVSGTGEGIKTNTVEEQESDKTDLMEVSDQVTPETLAETYVIAYKFIETIMGLILDARYKPQSSLVNPIQANFLEDTIKQFSGQLHEFVTESQTTYGIDTSEITVSALSLAGTRLILEGNTDTQTLEQYLSSEINNASVTNEEIQTKLLMVKSDLYELLVSLLEDAPENNADPTVVFDNLWALTSSLSKTLSALSKTLNEKRTSIISGKLRTHSEQLSSTVFRQCDVIINSADNELRRAWILECKDQITALEGGTGKNQKTIEILHKNARTLLINATKIAERPCGLEECIVDKLKRNYIFNQARGRSALLDGSVPPTTTDLLDQISDHPFYKKIINNMTLPVPQ